MLENLTSAVYNCMPAAPAATDGTAADAAAAMSGTDIGCLGGGSMLVMLLVYGGLFFILWLVLIRPQNKKRKQEEEMRKNVDVGDEITTIGGICGRVVSIKDDDSYIIETGAEKNKIKIMRWSILQNNTIKEAAPEEAATKKKGLFGFLKK